MRKKFYIFTALASIVFCFIGIYGMVQIGVSADTVSLDYYLETGVLDNFDTNTQIWNGAPNDPNCYVKTNNKLNPGSKYSTALCFTAPCNGRISASNSGSFGTVYLDTDADKIVDGVRFSVFKNTMKIYPTTEEIWHEVPAKPDKLNIELSELTMEEGDKLYYIVDNGGNGNNSWDTTYLVMGFNWTSEGQTNKVWFDSNSGRWTDEQSGNTVYNDSLDYPKKELLSYHYISVLQVNEKEDIVTDNKKVLVDATEYSFTNLNGTTPAWAIPDRKDCYVTADLMVPNSVYAAAICFTAPCDGKISNGLGCGKIYRSGKIQDNTDGTRLSVVLNDTVVYPFTGIWADIPNSEETALNITFNNMNVKEGDKLWYVVDCGGNENSNWDLNKITGGFLWVDELNPNGVYVDFAKCYWTDETSGLENVNFGEYHRKDVFGYYYVSVLEKHTVPDVSTEGRKVVVNNKEYVFTELNGTPIWGGVPGRNTYCYVTADLMVPNEYYAAAICFTAPCDGIISNEVGGGKIYRSGQIKEDTDGTRLSVVLNDTVVYPFTGIWADIPNSEETALNITFNNMNVKEGDKLWYVVDCGGNYNSSWDSNKFSGGFLWVDELNPNGVYVDFAKCYWTDETSGLENVNFGEYHRKDVFGYYYAVLEDCASVGPAQELNARSLSNRLEIEKLNYSQSKGCYIKIDDPKMLVYSDYCQPGDYDALAIVWTAPASGRLDLSKSWICNFNYHPELNINGLRSDGVRIKIVLNGDKQIFPVEDEWITINSANRYSITIAPFAVNAGDRLIFVLDNNGACNWDNCNYNIVITFAENDADYTNTYRNIIDFKSGDINESAWSYHAVIKNTEEDEQIIEPLVILDYNAKGSGCSANVDFDSFVFVIICFVGIMMILYKRSTKKVGKNNEKNH